MGAAQKRSMCMAVDPGDSQPQKGFSVLLMGVSPCHPQIREQNLQDIKTAGPQSQVLCGVAMDRSLVQVRAQDVSDMSGWWH